MDSDTIRDERLSTASFVHTGEHGDPHSEHLGSSGGAAMAREERPAALLNQEEAERFRHEWTDIQAGFVDEPRKAVEQADSLVATAIKRLAEVFSEERGKLEGHWDKGDEVNTEDLRVALQRYRSFFNRLLSV